MQWFAHFGMEMLVRFPINVVIHYYICEAHSGRSICVAFFVSVFCYGYCVIIVISVYFEDNVMLIFLMDIVK